MAIFLNLPEIAINKEAVSSKSVADKWVSRTYSTKLGEGVLVYAAQSVYPEPLKLRLNLKGMHRIYVGVLKLHAQSYGHIKLTDDLCYTGIKPSPHGNPKGWMHCEYAEEIYWKSADLTNQQIIIENGGNGQDDYREQGIGQQLDRQCHGEIFPDGDLVGRKSEGVQHLDGVGRRGITHAQTENRPGREGEQQRKSQ